MTSDEPQKGSSKPTLDAEGFQRLLAAAYILQSRSEAAVRPISIPDTKAFASTAIHLKRTPSIRELSGRSGHLGLVKEANIAPRPTRLMLWKQVEAFGIAIVFCLMMGMSIHRLLASSGRASQVPGLLETPEAAPLPSPPSKVLTSFQQNASVQEPVDDDLIIYHRSPAAPTGTTSKSRARTTISGQEKLAAIRVVQYGDDVTMWSSGKSSPGQPPHRQSGKSSLNR